MKTLLFIAEIIPLLLFYVILLYPDQTLLFSVTPLGRLMAVLLVLFYTSIHSSYGLVVCIFIILYYQTDMVESMSDILPIQANPSLAYSPFSETPALLTKTKNTKPKDNNHGWDIFDWFEHNEDTTYEGFTTNGYNPLLIPLGSDTPCNRTQDLRLGEVQKLGKNQYTAESSPKVMVTDQNKPTMGEVLAIHETLVYPKHTVHCETTNDPLVHSWFTHDFTKPYPTFGLVSNPFSAL
jgi:hypothetical protein